MSRSFAVLTKFVSLELCDEQSDAEHGDVRFRYECWPETEAGGACSASIQEPWLGSLDNLRIDNTAEKRCRMRLPPGLHTGICMVEK